MAEHANTTASSHVETLHQRAQRLTGFLAQDPGNLALTSDLADLLLELGETEEAQKHVSAALALQPQDQPMRYRHAVILHRLGQLPQAQAALSELLAQGVDAPAVRFELARVQFARGEFAQAVQTLAPLCQTGSPPEFRPVATFLSVRGLHQLGELDAAIQLAEAALAQEGSTGWVEAPMAPALATLYLDAGRNAEAAQLYEREAEADRLDAELLSVGGYLSFSDADMALAQARFQASLAAAPHMGRAHLGLGLTHATQGDLSRACHALEAAVQAMPTHLGTWHALAWMRLLSRDLDGAESAFRQAMDIDHNFGETHGGLALLAALRGDRTAAQGHSRTAHRLDPSSFNLAAAHLLGQLGGGMESEAFQGQAFQLLHDRVLSQDEGLRTLFDKLMRARPRLH